MSENSKSNKQISTKALNIKYIDKSMNVNTLNMNSNNGVIGPKTTKTKRYKTYDLAKQRYVNYVDPYGRPRNDYTNSTLALGSTPRW